VPLAELVGVQARWAVVAVGALLAGAGLYLTHDEGKARTARASSPAAATHRIAVQPAAAAAPAATPKPVPGEVVVSARWGGAEGELGRRAANESSPEGPMSFAVDRRGAVLVLDQVNARVSTFESGSVRSTVALPRDTFQDIETREGGGFAALDRFGSASVAYFDAAGNLTHEVPLVGPGVESGGDVTALFERDDGTWVETKHEGLVQIADSEGQPLAERTTAHGRFAADGSALRMSKSGATAANLVVIEPGGSPRALARVEFPLRVWQLLALETDARGRIVLAADLFEESSEPPFARLAAAEQVVVLDRDGRELDRFELPAADGADESFRRVRVAPDGTIHHMAFAESGVTIRRLGR
jgi:hypothetical protein